MKFTFQLTPLLLLLISCGPKYETTNMDFRKGDFKDYDSSKFQEEKGIVYQTDYYFSFKYLEKLVDVYYMYNLERDTLTDVIPESTLFGLRNGDVITVLVHGDDYRINFYNGRGYRKPNRIDHEP